MGNIDVNNLVRIGDTLKVFCDYCNLCRDKNPIVCSLPDDMKIGNMEAVDAKPIIRGKWIHMLGYPMPKCSICMRYSMDSLSGGVWCSHCGAYLGLFSYESNERNNEDE